MAKQAKRPVEVPEGVKVSLDGRVLGMAGPVGKMALELPAFLTIDLAEGKILVSCSGEHRELPRKMQRNLDGLTGLYRALIKNRLASVKDGVSRVLNISGVGYQANVKGKTLELKVGFSHPVEMDIPEGVAVKVERSVITVSGVDPLLVGDFAARTRAVRPPEPYGGKGIRYADEYVRRKVSKTAAGAAGGK